MICEFNNRGEKIKEDGDFFFTDSIFIDGEHSRNDSVSVFILISHRPQTSLQLKIESMDEKEHILAAQEIGTKARLVRFNFPLIENTHTLRLTSSRYDSITQKNKTFIIVRKLR